MDGSERVLLDLLPSATTGPKPVKTLGLMCFPFALHFRLEQGHVGHKIHTFTIKLDGSVTLRDERTGFGLFQVINFFFFSLDGDPEEACKQELSCLYGAIQGEQLSECEERLWHHPLFSRNEHLLCGKDPQSQTEHGQRLDVTLKRKQINKTQTLQIRAVQLLPLSPTAVSKVICETVPMPQALPCSPPSSLCSTGDRASVSFIMSPYSSVFGLLGGVRSWEVDGRVEKERTNPLWALL